MQNENAQTASGVRTTLPLVVAIAATGDPAATNEVTEGSIVKNLYIEHWVKSFAAAGEDTKFQYVL